MRQQRRAERRRAGRPTTAQKRATQTSERQLQRLVLALAGIGLAALVAILSIGFYRSNIAPPGRVVAETTGGAITLREVVPVAKLIRLSNGLADNFVGSLPQDGMNLLIRDAILRERTGPAFGVEVTQADLDIWLVSQFEPEESFEGQTPVTLTEAGRTQYEEFLDRAGVSDEEYQRYLEGELYFNGVQTTLERILPDEMEQVLLHWIVVSNTRDAEAAKARLDAGEDFATVAGEVSQERSIADENGEVGWVPQGVFTELDEAIFALEAGQYTDPIAASFGVVIAYVTEGPVDHELSEQMRTTLAGQQGSDWFQGQLVEAIVSYDFNDDDVNWVARQLR
ncbi:MAG: peptidylprolyl isomerase [Chloroflexi bacterium]|nr:peptidylprolyl isomerase [Chloroflexota bacterium]